MTATGPLKLIVLLGGSLLALPALARPELVVFDVNDAAGKGTGKEIRREIVESLQKRAEDLHVMRLDKWKAVAKKKKVRGKAAQKVTAIKKVAPAAKVTHVLIATVVRKGGGYDLAAKLYDRRGREMWRKSFPVTDGSLGPAADRVAAGIFAVLGIAAPAEESMPLEGEAPPPMGEPVAEGASPAEDPPEGGLIEMPQSPPEGGEPPPPDAALPAEESVAKAEPQVEDAPEGEMAAAAAEPPSPARLFRIQVGSPITLRTYSLKPNSDPAGGAVGKPVDYKTDTPYFGVAADVEVSPFHKMGPALRGLGVAGGYSRGFVKTRYTPFAGAAEREFASTDERYFGDLYYRYTFNADSRFATQLGARGGYGIYAFNVEPNLILQRSFRQTARGGLEVIQSLVPPYLALRVMGLYLPMAKPSEEEQAAYGTPEKTIAYEVQAGLRGEIVKGLGWALDAVMVAVSDTYKAGGRTIRQGGTAKDQYLGAVVGVGYAY
jgi:hypothetical protein